MVNFVDLCRSICTGLYFFLTGVEYAIIIPTLYGYLDYLGAEQYFLGLVLSAFSLTGLISAPIYGRISDKTKTCKAYIIIGNLFETGGNFMYFASINKYMALFSRLIAGIGAGASSSIYGMISRTTSKEERTKAFSKFLLLRQIGIVVGPACNIFLNSIDLTLGPFKVNSFNSPGLLMTLVWTIHTVLIILFYKDPVLDAEIEEATNASSSSNQHLNINSSTLQNDVRVRSFKDEFLRDEVIVCLSANFLGIFSQCGTEAALTPTTKILFGWGGLQNSYFFGAGGAMVVVGYLSLNVVSKYVSDRALLLFGVMGMVGVYIMETIVFTYLRIHPEKIHAAWVFPVFLITVAVLVVALPYAWATQASIFSKITSMETQAFNQGIRIASLGMGQILGPIWASSLATIDGLPIMVGVNLLLNCVLLCMIMCSYERLRTTSENTPACNGTSNNTSNDISPDEFDESSPLLSS